MAIAALVVGILAVLCLGPIAGIIALVLGFLGLKKAKEIGTGKGMSIAGIVLGAIGTVIWIIVVIAIFAGADSVSNRINDAFGEANPSDYDITTDSCKVDQSGFVEFDGTITNTANKNMSFTINTEIRSSKGSVLLDSPSTLVTVSEDDTAKWSVSAVLDKAEDIECKVTSVNDFFN